MSKFTLGQTVTWASQANGSTTTKTGAIVEVVPAGSRVSARHWEQMDASGLPRDHESYIIRVPGKTERSKGKLYWPHVSKLQPATPPADADRAEALRLAGMLDATDMSAIAAPEAVERRMKQAAALLRRLAAAPAVPEGWKLVPINATPEMLSRGRWSGSGDVSVSEEWARREVWDRMLAAAPAPEGGAA